MIKDNQLARFTNDFALNAEIGFRDARQLLLFLALISQTNPQDDTEEMTGIVSIKDIEKLIRVEGAKRSGSLKKEVSEFIEKMMQRNYVKFESATKHLKNYGVIFDRLHVLDTSGGKFYEYRFHEDMRPHVKGLLKDFVSLALPKNMKSGHSIRFLMLAKSYHDRHKHGRKETTMSISIVDLKRLLGIEGKYPKFPNFRRRVIEPMVAEVNKSRFLSVNNYDFIRTGRKITHIEFRFQDGDFLTTVPKNQNQMALDFDGATAAESVSKPISETEIEQLTHAQYLAYTFLLEKGCIDGIAYHQIIPKMPSSECRGWEDITLQKAWGIFEKSTNKETPKEKIGAFVKWWLNGNFQDKAFSELLEALLVVKKSKERNEPQNFTNRLMAQEMTRAEFLEAVRKEQETVPEPKPSRKDDDFESIGDLVKLIPPIK